MQNMFFLLHTDEMGSGTRIENSHLTSWMVQETDIIMLQEIFNEKL